MLITLLSGQLGNTMFQYAVTKTIAQEKNLVFRYYRIPTPLINSSDSVLGSEIDSIFPIPADEKVENTHSCKELYHEPPAHVRLKPNYKQLLYNDIRDGLIVNGVFATPALIEHNLDNIRKWFTFPEASVSNARDYLSKTVPKGQRSCAVHFRIGRDYFSLGYKLHSSYWIAAAEEVLKRHPDTHFICIYDKRGREVTEFIKKFNASEHHGSLVDDMALMTQTDINIVCNSTFSIMGTLLNAKCILGICPGIYPPPEINVPHNVYSSRWIHIESARQDRLSKCALALRNAAKRILSLFHLYRS